MKKYIRDIESGCWGCETDPSKIFPQIALNDAYSCGFWSNMFQACLFSREIIPHLPSSYFFMYFCLSLYFQFFFHFFTSSNVDVQFPPFVIDISNCFPYPCYFLTLSLFIFSTLFSLFHKNWNLFLNFTWNMFSFRVSFCFSHF